MKTEKKSSRFASNAEIVNLIMLQSLHLEEVKTDSEVENKKIKKTEEEKL